ncbi:MAG: bifunctional glutamate N-acetyltransferase/amino-acid acetyltransferase ArgJ [Deltaproteobacteria bacterium]|nr:bifunctional glutamate N-acetyltransferase/amino-acid acetyltransferase ArgJ [Deltaproteobacteria bacterium]
MRVKGFKFSAVASGMRYKKRPDLAIIVSQTPAAATAAVFTRNICRAAPVAWSSDLLNGGRAPAPRAIMVNAGQANAQTGAEGLEHCRLSAQWAARELGLGPDEILLASTGIIGQPMNMGALEEAIPRLASWLKSDMASGPEAAEGFSKAIMTTDTVPKTASAPLRVGGGGGPAALWGCAKGAGMMAPDMATMLAFIVTDLPAEKTFLQKALKRCADATFNRVTVDGDTSTNDSLFLMSSGAAGGRTVAGGRAGEAFEEGLLAVCDSLARQIVRDAEGATRLVEVVVVGGRNKQHARLAAKTVAESLLVKTALYGRDANWGRILAALGRSGALFNPDRVEIDLDDVPWVREGRDNGREEEAAKVLNEREYRLTINLRAGLSRHSYLTCDISHDYVDINGSYRS